MPAHQIGDGDIEAQDGVGRNGAVGIAEKFQRRADDPRREPRGLDRGDEGVRVGQPAVDTLPEAAERGRHARERGERERPADEMIVEVDDLEGRRVCGHAGHRHLP